jgi:hypothetical protein
MPKNDMNPPTKPEQIECTQTTEVSAMTDAINIQSGESIFTSKHWLEASIKSWPDSLKWKALSLQHPNESMKATAIIGTAYEIRHKILRSNLIAFNQTGSPEYDEPYIEMNGFYGASPKAFEYFFDQTLKEMCLQPFWDEFKVSGLLEREASIVKRLAEQHGLTTIINNRKPTYWVDLNKIKDEYGGDIYKFVSPNTRQQIRRAIRSIEREIGPVSLKRADSKKTALDWFEATGEWHRMRWQTKSQKKCTGFDNQNFTHFHKNLIRDSFDDGVIEYLKLTAGIHTLAYLYNFRFKKATFFYLSGINYTLGEKFRPGIVAHTLAIENSLSDDAIKYDFMAGENRYKESLSTNKSEQQWLTLQRPRPKLKLESLARKLKFVLSRSFYMGASRIASGTSRDRS